MQGFDRLNPVDAGCKMQDSGFRMQGFDRLNLADAGCRACPECNEGMQDAGLVQPEMRNS